jgi:hypothetical protein
VAHRGHACRMVQGRAHTPGPLPCHCSPINPIPVHGGLVWAPTGHGNTGLPHNPPSPPPHSCTQAEHKQKRAWGWTAMQGWGGPHAPGRHVALSLRLHVGVPCKWGPHGDGNAPPPFRPTSMRAQRGCACVPDPMPPCEHNPWGPHLSHAMCAIPGWCARGWHTKGGVCRGCARGVGLTPPSLQGAMRGGFVLYFDLDKKTSIELCNLNLLINIFLSCVNKIE